MQNVCLWIKLSCHVGKSVSFISPVQILLQCSVKHAGLCSPLPATLAYPAICEKAPTPAVGTQTLRFWETLWSSQHADQVQEVSLESLTFVLLLRMQEHGAVWGVNATLDYMVLDTLEMEKLGRTLSIFQKLGSFVAFQTPDKALYKQQNSLYSLPSSVMGRWCKRHSLRAYVHHSAAPCYPQRTPPYFLNSPKACRARQSSASWATSCCRALTESCRETFRPSRSRGNLLAHDGVRNQVHLEFVIIFSALEWASSTPITRLLLTALRRLCGFPLRGGHRGVQQQPLPLWGWLRGAILGQPLRERARPATDLQLRQGRGLYL